MTMVTATEEQPQVKEEQLEREYSKIILNLDNILLDESKLSNTPSIQEGLDHEEETDLRHLGCDMIQNAGILLKAPQVAMATGQILFQRFYYSKSFVRHAVDIVAMAALNLALKIEETPRRVRDVINVFHHIRLVKDGKDIKPLVLDLQYVGQKNTVIKAERRILKELGFCVHVKHPHKLIFMYLKFLDNERNVNLCQKAWNYMNDSLRTDVFMRYTPEVIACACIFLAARNLCVPLPEKPAWYELFGASYDQLIKICVAILKLYQRPKPNAKQLDEKVNLLKKKFEDKRQKAKLAYQAKYDKQHHQDSPNADSPFHRTRSPPPLPKNVLKIKKQIDDEHAKRVERSKEREKKEKSRSLSPVRKPRDKHKRRRSRSRSRSKSPAGGGKRYETLPKAYRGDRDPGRKDKDRKSDSRSSKKSRKDKSKDHYRSYFSKSSKRH